ncbi:MAG: hypothetical protein QOF58_5739 [Pseudonocardiales bacterium]|jgi:hypothetical protein|nr:hypothetical protein [Pseudonocardiales bacterium]
MGSVSAGPPSTGVLATPVLCCLVALSPATDDERVLPLLKNLESR